MGSQHPSPNVKTLCNFELQLWLEIITSHDAESICSKGSRMSCDVIILGIFAKFWPWKKHITWWMLPADIRLGLETCQRSASSGRVFKSSSSRHHYNIYHNDDHYHLHHQCANVWLTLWTLPCFVLQQSAYHNRLHTFLLDIKMQAMRGRKIEIERERERERERGGERERERERSEREKREREARERARGRGGERERERQRQREGRDTEMDRYFYIYIYIYRERERTSERASEPTTIPT